MVSIITISPIYPSSLPQSKTATAPSLPSVVSLFKNGTMPIAKMYFLANMAWAKLSHETAHPDHNLRLLVGHASLINSLMLALDDAKREQELAFEQSVHGTESEERRTQRAGALAEELEEDWQSEDTDSESSSDSDSCHSEEERIENSIWLSKEVPEFRWESEDQRKIAR
jgi:hypothetical protein